MYLKYEEKRERRGAYVVQPEKIKNFIFLKK
jgi:hypothetical protein